MPDAKFESGSLSIFKDMMSQNFPFKNGTSHQFRIFTAWKPSVSISAIFKQRKFLEFLRHVDEERETATPLSPD